MKLFSGIFLMMCLFSVLVQASKHSRGHGEHGSRIVHTSTGSKNLQVKLTQRYQEKSDKNTTVNQEKVSNNQEKNEETSDETLEDSKSSEEKPSDKVDKKRPPLAGLDSVTSKKDIKKTPQTVKESKVPKPASTSNPAPKSPSTTVGSKTAVPTTNKPAKKPVHTTIKESETPVPTTSKVVATTTSVKDSEKAVPITSKPAKKEPLSTTVEDYKTATPATSKPDKPVSVLVEESETAVPTTRKVAAITTSVEDSKKTVPTTSKPAKKKQVPTTVDDSKTAAPATSKPVKKPVPVLVEESKTTAPATSKPVKNAVHTTVAESKNAVPATNIPAKASDSPATTVATETDSGKREPSKEVSSETEPPKQIAVTSKQVTTTSPKKPVPPVAIIHPAIPKTPDTKQPNSHPKTQPHLHPTEPIKAKASVQGQQPSGDTSKEMTAHTKITLISILVITAAIGATILGVIYKKIRYDKVRKQFLMPLDHHINNCNFSPGHLASVHNQRYGGHMLLEDDDEEFGVFNRLTYESGNVTSYDSWKDLDY